MMTAFLIRLEGVNLSSYVYDVTDLSTIRGGSLQLLEAAAGAKQTLKSLPVTAVESISTGASAALLRFHADVEGKKIAGEVAGELRKLYPHATFVVDAIAENDFATARESVLAMNRWRQMQQPSLAIPALSTDPSKSGAACAIDFVTPAAKPTAKGAVSASVDARRTFGRQQKRSFYAHAAAGMDHDTETPKALSADVQAVVDAGFVEDFDQLTSDSTRGNLHHKMAVLYFDGNRFGEIQRTLGSDDLSRFDRDLKDCRSGLLARLLAAMHGNAGAWENGGRYRIETLLWGGDELTWVVPAWVGWEVIRLFYDATRDWQFDRANDAGSPLTHAGGIVFCHHSAPIRRITKLAHDLAERAKSLEKSMHPDNREGRNLFAYEILESFDSIGTDLDSFRDRRLPSGSHVEHLYLRRSTPATISNEFPRVSSAVPRSKLFDIVRAQRVGDPVTAKRMIDSLFAVLDDDARTAMLEIASERGFGALGSQPRSSDDIDPIVWVHLADLWDYLPPEVTP
jgi:hypothetical protein